MSPDSALKRHYAITKMDFADFWDTCGYFLKVHPNLNKVVYTIEGTETTVAEDETDVAKILEQLNEYPQDILLMEAKLEGPNTRAGHASLVYRPQAVEDLPAGLEVRSQSLTKLILYEFESLLYEKYQLADDEHASIKFGKPCEVLAAIVDLRGFSQFCEKPNIESPYTCGLMHSFYQAVQKSYLLYPPEMLKFLGDGVLALWETTPEDRDIAIDVCLKGSIDVHSHWQVVRRSTQFSHGAPDEVAIGVSFGLASQLPGVGDYIGRPINIASRLSIVCPGGQVFVDKAVPSIGPQYAKEDATAHIKSFGRYYIWRIQAG